MRKVLPVVLLTGCWPVINASIPPDGGSETDAGTCVCPSTDAGPSPVDAGESDAGSAADAGEADAGLLPDGGSAISITAPLVLSPQTVVVAVAADGASFTPATVTIHVGDTVLWIWAASGHSVTSGPANGAADDGFCSPGDQGCSQGLLSDAGTTYAHTFSQAGRFPYFCAAHRAMGMTGTVVVVP